MNPRISCVNQATVDLGVDFNTLIGTLNKFVNGPFAEVWGAAADLVVASEIKPGEWGMVFLDDADQAGALAYHDVTADGLPLSKVFVKTTLADGQPVSIPASHETFETLADSGCNLCAVHPDGTFFAYENCDATEELSFDYQGVQITDFVLPSWFEGFRKPNSTRFDYMGKVTEPFQLLPGGYAIVFKRKKWKEIFGSQEKAERFAREDRRGHRSELRKFGEHGNNNRK